MGRSGRWHVPESGAARRLQRYRLHPLGSDYYAISSTFQFSPGVVILHSKDLVNWSIRGHAANDITQIGPELNWDRMNRYGRGVWAGAIRYHDQRFWVYFGTPDEGYFMTTATNPSGSWEPLHPVLMESGWDDCCPFWDEDGQGYLIATHFLTTIRRTSSSSVRTAALSSEKPAGS